MKLEKHQESLKEVLDEINVSLKDPRGLPSHQRRVAMMLSIGVCDLIAIYFHKLLVLKTGAHIKHDWFKQKRIKEKLGQQITSPIDSIANISIITSLAAEIEKSRDNLAYGSPIREDKLMLKKINQFFELKKIIVREIGDLHGTK